MKTLRGKPQHIVLLTPGFPVDESDTTCIPPLQSFAQSLSKVDGVEVSVIAVHYPYKKKKYQWKGISIYGLGGDNRKGWRKARVFFEAKKLLTGIHQEQPIDRVHSFWLSDAAFIGARFSSKFGVPHTITLMGQDALTPVRYMKLIKPSADQFVALSQNQLVAFKKSTGMDLSKVISWGADIASPNLNQPRTIDVIGVGALTELKNYQLFLSVIARVHSESLLNSVQIFGDGPERENLENLVQELGLSEVVKLNGHVPRKQVLEAMASSRLLLHTSHYESFGYVFMEALASGTEIVSTNVGGASDLASNHWEVGATEEELAEHLKTLLNRTRIPVKPLYPSMEETVSEYLKFWG